MKKSAAILIVFGSGLAAFGFAGWQSAGHSTNWEAVPGWDFSAGWPLNSQFEITVGIMLLALGMILRSDSK